HTHIYPLALHDALPISGSTVSSATLTLNLVASDATTDPTYTVTAHAIVNKNPVLTAATGYTYDGVTSWTPNTCCYNNVPLAQARSEEHTSELQSLRQLV